MPRLDPPPALVAELEARWRVRIGPPLAHGGVSAWVAPASRGAERVAVKIVEQHEESRDEAAGLRAWNGRGAVRLLDEHVVGPTTALLLEWCDGPALSERPAPEQDAVLVDLLPRLWIDPPAGVRPLAQMCAWWADSAAAQGVPEEFADALDLFRSLPIGAPRDVLLATDLHAGNVLAAGREPWLMVDPKPYAGDPHYDVLQHLLNDPTRLRVDASGWLRRLAGPLGLDADRLRAWLYARCVLAVAQKAPGHLDLIEVARLVR